MKGWIDQVNSNGVFSIAESIGIKKTRGRGLSPCPSCGAETRGSSDKRGSIGVSSNDQGWRCFRCDVAGDAAQLAAYHFLGCSMAEAGGDSLSDLKKELQEMNLISFDDKPRYRPDKKLVSIRPKTQPKNDFNGLASSTGLQWSDGLSEACQAVLWSDEGREVLDYLKNERKLNDETIKFWGLGCYQMINSSGELIQKFLTIPAHDEKGQAVNIKFRSVTGKKRYMRCKGRPSTLYGLQTLTNKDQPVVILEGELDVISLWQLGITENIVSGTAGAGCFLEEWLDQLEPFREFLICYDSDEAGNNGASELAKKLGHYRCSKATLPFSDMSECVQNGVEAEVIVKAFDEAGSFLSAQVKGVGSYSEDLEKLIENPETLRGKPTGSGQLDEALGGWRSGLVVITGDTGSGKTSFATWAALQQARQGVSVLLTSYEQRPIGTVQKLLRMQVGDDFTNVSQEVRKKGFNYLDKLPIHLIDHYGHMTFEDLVETIRFAIRRRGCSWILVDHLGFIADPNAKDERREIERCVRELATVAVNEDVTIVLICHPNNMAVAQQRRVQITDLKGASAIRQDAHVGIVVERLIPSEKNPYPCSAIHLDKIRSEFGLTGSRVVLYYDPLACVYADSWIMTPLGQRS